MVLDLTSMEIFSFGNGLGKNCIIFGGDLISSLLANKKNNVLVFGKDLVQGKNGTTIYAENCIKSISLKKKLFKLAL